MPILHSEQAAAAVTGGLLQHVHIIDPDIGVWHGRYILKDAKVSLGTENVTDAGVTSPQIRLMEQSEWLKNYRDAFNVLIAEVKSAVTFYSEPFPIRGLRMVPHQAAEDLLYELIGRTENGVPVRDYNRFVPRLGNNQQSIAYRLDQLADDFCGNWRRVISDIKENVSPAIWSRICGRLPTSEDARKKFYLRVTRVRLAASDESDRVTAARGALTVGDLAKYADYIDHAARAQIDAAVLQATTGPREAFAKALSDLNDLIQRDGRITDRSFNAVRAAISKLRAFSFIASPALLQQAAELESRIEGITVSSFDRDTAIASGFAASLQQITDDARSDAQIEDDIRRFGRAHRALDLS